MSFVKILYGGIDAFYPQPVPIVAVEESNIYYGEQWAKEEVFSLEGNLTGCDFPTIVAAQSGLVANFRSNFQTLKIWEQDDPLPSGLIYQKDLVYVDSITFPASTWRGVLPYSIKLRSYPSGYFSGAFGILNPTEVWSFQEGQDRSATVTHSLSCRALNTTSGPQNNSLSNAINWATAKRGTASIVTPQFIANVYSGNFCLTTTAEEMNRINGTYSVVDTYRTDLTRSGYGILRYAGTVTSGDTAIDVRIEGSVQGCNTDIASVRQVFQGFNVTGAALKTYNNVFNLNDLNPIPLSNTIEELPYDARLTFSYDFDTNNLPTTYLDYTVSLSSGDNITVAVEGEVISRGGDIKTKLAAKKAFASGLNLYQTVLPFYNTFYPYAATAPLNPRPISSGINISEYQGTLSVNAQFTNQDQVSSLLDSFDYTIEFTPSVTKVDFKQTVNGLGAVSMTSLGYANRAALFVKGTSRINPSVAITDGLNAIRDKAQTLFSTYGRTTNAIIERNTTNADRTDQRLVSFEFGWSFDSPNVVATSPFTQVATLAL